MPIKSRIDFGGDIGAIYTFPFYKKPNVTFVYKPKSLQ